MAGPDTEKPHRLNRVVSALGTTRFPRPADRRLRGDSDPKFLEVSRGSADQADPSKEEDFELGSETNWTAMKVSNAGRDMGVLRHPLHAFRMDWRRSSWTRLAP